MMVFCPLANFGGKRGTSDRIFGVYLDESRTVVSGGEGCF